MKYALLFFSLISFSAMAQQDSLQRFPDINANTLDRQSVQLPRDVNRKVNILILVFEKQAQLLVNTWAEVILKEFEPQADISYMEVPMMSGWWSPIGWQIDNWMRDGIPEQYHDNTATFYGNRSSFFKGLAIEDQSSCYLFVLDEEGYIHHRAEGPMKEDGEQALRVAIDRLMNDENLSDK
ncbi:MAG: hypothetical protein AAFP19_10565 [Bacteroidota bacterium]